MALTACPDLYLLRHGQTEWNAEGRLQGRRDSRLTELGLLQAQRQADLVATLPPGLNCFSSPAGRAVHTAEIALKGRAFRQDMRLHEIDVGEFTGLREAELRRARPDVFQGNTLDWYDRTPGGEHFAALRARLTGFLAEVQSPALIVTHGVALRMIRLLAMDLPDARIDDLPVRQGAVHIVRNGVEVVLI